jgi:aminopeptidase N
MRYTISGIILILIFSLPASAQTRAEIDMLHYRFSLILNDSTDLIQGEAMLRFRATDNLNRVVLDLNGVAEGKGMEVASVAIKGQHLKFEHKTNKLTIELPGFKKSDTGELTIRYSGIPSNGLVISKTKFGRRTFFGDNWPDRAHYWLPCKDEPGDKATLEFIVEAPSHYKVVSNGLLQEESALPQDRKRTHWKQNVPLSTKIMVIGVADFDVQYTGIVQGVQVSSWVFPENSEKGFYDYALAPGILDYFIKTYGPYGFEKLANVQSKTMYGGVENASAIFYSENSVTGTRRSEALLAHEIAHQWFGDMATETAFSHLWLSEGFATYMTCLYMKQQYGLDTFQVMMKNARNRVVNFAKTYYQPVVDTSTSDYMKLLNANSYQKGGWALHMLRVMIGDSAFYRSVRKYYATYFGKNANTRDLQKIFETVSGKDLKAFFDQWLYTPGHPVLKLNWKYDAATRVVSIDIEQQQQNIFRFPLDIQLKVNGKNIKNTIQVSKKNETINIRVAEKPGSLVLDPELILLHEAVIESS